MNLRNVFLISIYAMTALAGAMLAYGEETPFPSGLTVILSALALLFNDRRGWWRLPRLAGNLLGLAALGAAAFEFFGERADARLLAGAHCLVYITWIVLFQAKEMRHYWWLCALSLLQVALGPLLTLSTGWYGILLLVYLLLAIWTLSVFTLYHGAVEFGAIPATDDRPARDWPRGPCDRPGSNADPVAAFRRAFAANRRGDVRDAVQQDFAGRWIVPRFIALVLGLALAGFALGLGMFLFVPRVWIGSGLRVADDPSPGRVAVTGFSDQVRLGQLGEILESNARVMVVEMFDNDSDEPLDIDEFAEQQGCPGPLFRGNVLDRYASGRWSADNRASRTRVMRSWPQHDGMVRQAYTLEMRGSDVLFAMAPFEMARLQPYDTVTVNVGTDVLTTQSEGHEPLLYRAYSTPRRPRNNSPAPAVKPPRRPIPPGVLARSRQLPDEGLERLIALALDLRSSDKRAGGEDVSPGRRLALTLEAHLRDSGRYAYSLNMSVNDPTIDPVEDFLFNRKRGHCEYFASALALMLRAVEIPSRLVTGFKGCDPLARRGAYEVQQRHAHAWVEAYVDGQWIILDPTPAARDESVRERSGGNGFWSNARNSISSLWTDYVVALSLNRQQQSLYDPLQGSVSSGWGAVRQAMRRVVAAAGDLKNALASPENLFSPRAATMCLVAAAAAVAACRLVRRRLDRDGAPALRLARRRGWIARLFDWLGMRLAGRSADPARVVVAFYEQFQTLVGIAGLTPRQDQTQREFARQVEASLGKRLAPAGLQKFPSELAELFYRVRFGDESLQAAETMEVENRLKRLRAALIPQQS
ncbi:MAG: transglutaminaseTgpA domain-containing protein [Deltaproteobacteria bacterium]